MLVVFSLVTGPGVYRWDQFFYLIVEFNSMVEFNG